MEWDGVDNLTTNQKRLLIELDLYYNKLYTIDDQKDCNTDSSEHKTPTIKNNHKDIDVVNKKLDVEFEQTVNFLHNNDIYFEILVNMVKNFSIIINTLENYDQNITQINEEIHSICKAHHEIEKKISSLTSQQEICRRYLHHYGCIHRLKKNLSNKTVDLFLLVELALEVQQTLEFFNKNYNFVGSDLQRASLRQFFQDITNKMDEFISNNLTYNNILAELYQNETVMNDNHVKETYTFDKFYSINLSTIKNIKFFIDEYEKRLTFNDELFNKIYNRIVELFMQIRKTMLTDLLKDSINSLINTTINKEKCSQPSLFILKYCKLKSQLVIKECDYIIKIFHTLEHNNIRNMIQQIYLAQNHTVLKYLATFTHYEHLTDLYITIQTDYLKHYHFPYDSLEEFHIKYFTLLLKDIAYFIYQRVHVYINDEIFNYKISSCDLAYPEKVLLCDSNFTGDKTTIETIINSPEMWYPPVRRTCFLLAKIHPCFSKEKFNKIAFLSVTTCVDLLTNAKNKMNDIKKPTIHGSLFYIKHLLILSQQIQLLSDNFEFKETRLEILNYLKPAAVTFFNDKKNIFKFNTNNPLLKFFSNSIPKIHEYTIDTFKILENNIRSECLKLINQSVKYIFGDDIVSLFEPIFDGSIEIIKLDENSTEDNTVYKHLDQVHIFKYKKQNDYNMVKVCCDNINIPLNDFYHTLSIYFTDNDSKDTIYNSVKNQTLNKIKFITSFINKNES